MIRYDLLVQDALRGMVRKVLADAARDGMPGDHHFFVSFKTHAPGVQLSHRMRAEYPEEITIVLQHQFSNLTVTKTQFEVNLSFKNIPERLIVPFDAVTGFADPAGPFEVKFEPQVLAEDETPVLTPVPDAPEAAEMPPARAKTAPKKDKVDKAEKPAARRPEPENEPAEDNQQGKVVSIDAFRKKT